MSVFFEFCTLAFTNHAETTTHTTAGEMRAAFTNPADAASFALDLEEQLYNANDDFENECLANLIYDGAEITCTENTVTLHPIGE